MIDLNDIIEHSVEKKTDTPVAAFDVTVNEILVADEKKLMLSSPNSEFTLQLKISGFENEKQQDSYIKCIEKLVRYSKEYKLWVSYILEVLGENYCFLTDENINECTIEIHHHPVTLYTICKTYILERMRNKQDFCTFDIAVDVIKCHFQNKVGYIPLLSNLHEKYHRGFLSIPIELVHGDYKNFLMNHELDEEDRAKVNELCNIKIKDCPQTWKTGNYPGIINSDKRDDSNDNR